MEPHLPTKRLTDKFDWVRRTLTSNSPLFASSNLSNSAAILDLGIEFGYVKHPANMFHPMLEQVFVPRKHCLHVMCSEQRHVLVSQFDRGRFDFRSTMRA
jgi:hypothetical protein